MIFFKKKLNYKGFSHVELAMLLVVVIGVSGVGYYVFKHGKPSHAAATYTNVGSISYDGQTFSAQACITAQTGTSPNEIDTIEALITANTEVGASATIPVTQPSAVSTDQNVVAADQTALTNAQDAIIDARSVTNAQAAAITSASSALTAAKAKLAADEALPVGPTKAYVTFNPSAYYTINGGSPVAEDSWSTASSSTIWFDLPPTVQTSDFSLGIEGPAGSSGDTGSISVGSIAICNVTATGPSQLTLDEDVVAFDLNVLNEARAAIADELAPTAAQEAAITADNAAWVAAKDKVILDEGGTVPASAPATATSTSKPVLTTKTTTTTSPIDYTSSTVPDPTLAKGTTSVHTKGVNGVSTTTWLISYSNGVQTSKKQISIVTTTAPINEVINQGTRVTPALTSAQLAQETLTNAQAAIVDERSPTAKQEAVLEKAVSAIQKAAGKPIVVNTKKGSVQIYSAIHLTTVQQVEAAQAARNAVPSQAIVTKVKNALKDIVHIHSKTYINVPIPFQTNQAKPITGIKGLNGAENLELINGSLVSTTIIK